MATSAPFAPGSISIRLYPHNELDAPGVVAELCAQAALALRLGFDGVMTSEHHGGAPGYLPNPLQMATFVLEENASGWAAACPLLLPLRPAALVAEEVAWLAARHPGRVGLGVAAGALPLDFEAMDVPLAEAVTRFKAELPRLVDMLRGRDLRGLDGDRAFQQCALSPVPVLSAAVSPAAARRAARCDAGILLEGMSPLERLVEICRAFDEAGGTAPKVLIRRVWIGAAQSELIERQRRFYQSIGASDRPMAEDQTLSGDDSGDLADRLGQLMTDVGADALNIRIQLPGMAAADVRDQITRLGTEVLPRLRSRFTLV
ncbi:MAG TPA: LLM class flavin-dependent oxidoreductase [Acidimicrobiales bacterium]|nr:LLM class flavin-dependent oxidoreductase [Acidimicrobiales bacterium]